MKLSVIIPLYNQNPVPAVKSILAQHGFNSNDVEILIWNDASTQIWPRHHAVLGEQCVRIFDSEKNEGAGKARQNALDKAQGDYVTFLDADDIWYNLLGLELFYQNVYNRVDQPELAQFGILEETREHKFIMGDPYAGSVCARFFRRDYLKTHNIRFHPELRPHEDVYFMRLLALNNPTTLNFGDYLYFWKYNPESTVRKNGGNFWQSEFSRYIKVCMMIRDATYRRGLSYYPLHDLGYIYAIMSRMDEQYIAPCVDVLKAANLEEWRDIKANSGDELEVCLRETGQHTTLPFRPPHMTIWQFFDLIGI